MTLNINLADPNVRRLMGENDSRVVGAPAKRELVHLAGDAPDPYGTDKRGLSSTVSLSRSAIAHPYVFYGDKVLVLDAYKADGEALKLHITCPRCGNNSMISSDRKDIELDLNALPPADKLRELPPHEQQEAAQGGRISVSVFECSWELPNAGAHRPGAFTVGETLCRWRVGISKNIAKDA